ncbi:hypothetical protein V5799_029015 [Amblyomma americanum]|uniref:Uncharacterized protein n=1 Tax=Amblyomma americanum TaxID=6943 RepID=A0AAQ4ESD7_AMBAM
MTSTTCLFATLGAKQVECKRAQTAELESRRQCCTLPCVEMQFECDKFQMSFDVEMRYGLYFTVPGEKMMAKISPYPNMDGLHGGMVRNNLI